MGKVKIEIDEKTAKVLGSIIDGVIDSLKNEKEDRLEKVKIMDKLETLTERLEEKSEIFWEDERMCTKENLEKLYNLFKQQEDFYDSVIRKTEN